MTGATTILNSGLAPVAGQVPTALSRTSASSFETHLASAKKGKDLGTLREAVEQLVASSLVLPSLAVLRESSMSAAPFAPGGAERRFGPLLDQELADQVTQGANFPLVDVIVNRLARTYGLMPEETLRSNQEAVHA